MDRAERRRQAREDALKPSLKSTGHIEKLDGGRFDKIYQGSPEDDVAPGEHVWAMFMVHRVRSLDNLFAGNWMADLESLILTSGPGCYVCEQTYSEAVEAAPCPGKPPGELRYVS